MEIFSFFKFYYNVIRNSPKKYDIAMGHPSGFIIMVTPLFVFIAFLFLMFFIPPTLLPLMYLWIPIIVGNSIFVMHTSRKGYEIQREQERQREEAERLHREKKRREAERRAEKEWEEYIDSIFRREERRRQERQRQERQRQQQSHSNDRASAIKLLGLSEGFTIKDVKKAYRKLSKIHHPDAGGTEENFKRLNRAYNYLMEQ